MDGSLIYVEITCEDGDTPRRFGRRIPADSTPEMIEAALLEVRCRAAAYFAKRTVAFLPH